MSDKKIQLPSGKYLLVEVPEGSSGFQIEPRWGMLLYYKAQPSFQNMSDRDMPEGDWQIIGKADSLDIDSWENEDILKHIPVNEKSTTLILKLKTLPV